MSFLIAAVLAIGLISILMNFTHPKNNGKKGKKEKSRAQIIKEANKRLAKDPHDAQGLQALGDVYYASQLWDKAYSIYDELSKLGIKDSTIDLFKADLRAGICAIQLNKFAEAINFLNGAFKLKPTSFEACFFLGQSLFKSEQFDKAVPMFKKALVIKQDAPGVYLMLGQCLYKGKKYRDCLPCFKKALDEEPGNKEALFDMADAMTQEGHGEKAIKVFMHLRPNPVYGARSCLEAGLFHMKINDIDSAIQDFEIGLKHENTPPETVIELEYNLAKCYFEKKLIQKGLLLLKGIRGKNQNYKDVNALISRYQELSQNSNLQVYISANNTDFVTLCRKFITTKYKNSNVRIQNIDVDVLYTDILAEILSSKWEDIALFRFFRTSGSTGEIYIREFHGQMSDLKAARGFCISAGTFTEEAHKYIEGRPIDLIEKNDLTKVLKLITI